MSLFGWFEEKLNEESEKREAIKLVVKELEAALRVLETHLQLIHQSREAETAPLVARARELFDPVKSALTKLAATVPVASFYRFCGQWKNSIQQAAFLASWIHFLEAGKLISAATFEELSSVPLGNEEQFHIEVDDFLLGVCNLFPELARLATNSVTLGDFKRPQKIATFLGDVYNGFRLLNLKNDALRKRFDGIKYDLKRVEGVVYDISIRGLNKE